MKFWKAERQEQEIWGYLLTDLVYSSSVGFLFKPDTAKQRWSWEADGDSEFCDQRASEFAKQEWKDLRHKISKHVLTYGFKDWIAFD